jgi:hypothetical protein
MGEARVKDDLEPASIVVEAALRSCASKTP